MSLFITSLNSGSNGNCYYVGNSAEAVLVDAGLTCRETEKRMKRLGLSMAKVKAIFISHEHGDHIRGAEVLSRKHSLPVYITSATLQHSRLRLDEALTRSFRPYNPVSIGSLVIHAFPKQHDASDPHSFIVEGGGIKIGIFTDIGTPCEHVVSHFKQCHAAFLEANYDEIMLEQGAYPRHLKKRISGDEGHLSNLQALELFTRHRPAFMSHLLLAHLSKENNSPEIVNELFTSHSGATNVIVASRYKESDVYYIQGIARGNFVKSRKVVSAQPVQASLF